MGDNNSRHQVKIDPVVLGPRMKLIRTQQGVSVGRVYQRLQMSQSTLNRLDKGMHDVRVSDLVEYAKVLGYELVLVQKSAK